MNNLTFYYSNHDDSHDSSVFKGFLNTPSGLLQEEHLIDFPQEDLTASIHSTIQQVMNTFDTQPQFSSQFEIDEIEFGIHISTDGKVAVVADGGVSASSASIKVKLKRKRI